VLEGMGEWEIDQADISFTGKLGNGISAEVFSGLWLGKEVAIKVITRDLSNMTAQMQKDLCRELAILTSLDHRNVVRMYGVLPYQPVNIVMEMCNGGTVFELLHETEVEISWLQNVMMGRDVAEAVRYLHNFDPQIIHRDLKSLNLLLSSQVSGPRDHVEVKVTDFGLARLKDAARDEPMTKDVGTCHWMAPEMLNSHAKYDEKVDTYSYAIILYEILCRKIPFEEVDPSQILRLVSDGIRPDMAMLPDDCPTQLRAMMKLCWDQDPSRRPTFETIAPILANIAQELG